MTGVCGASATVAIVRKDGSVVAPRALGARCIAPGCDPLLSTAAVARAFDTLASLTFLAAGDRSGGSVDAWPAMTMSAEGPARDILGIEVEEDGETHVVRLRGELDIIAADRVKDALVEIAGSTVVVDLGQLTFLDATGLSALLSAQKQVERQGHGFSIVRARGIVRRVFTLTDLDHLLDD